MISNEDKIKYIEENGTVVYTSAAASLDIKYYELGEDVYKIIYSDNKAVLVNKLSKDAMNRIINCSNLDFGDW